MASPILSLPFEGDFILHNQDGAVQSCLDFGGSQLHLHTEDLHFMCLEKPEGIQVCFEDERKGLPMGH